MSSRSGQARDRTLEPREGLEGTLVAGARVMNDWTLECLDELLPLHELALEDDVFVDARPDVVHDALLVSRRATWNAPAELLRDVVHGIRGRIRGAAPASLVLGATALNAVVLGVVGVLEGGDVWLVPLPTPLAFTTVERKRDVLKLVLAYSTVAAGDGTRLTATLRAHATEPAAQRRLSGLRGVGSARPRGTLCHALLDAREIALSLTPATRARGAATGPGLHAAATRPRSKAFAR